MCERSGAVGVSLCGVGIRDRSPRGKETGWKGDFLIISVGGAG